MCLCTRINFYDADMFICRVTLTTHTCILVGPDHQLSDLHSNTRALKCLLDAMQDNSSKITSDVKSELKRLGRIVENLARNYERLEKQVQDLKQGESSVVQVLEQGESSATTASVQPMYGNTPPRTGTCI